MKSVLKFSFQLRFILTSSSLSQNVQRNYFASSVCLLMLAKIYHKLSALALIALPVLLHNIILRRHLFPFLFGDLLHH